jgi:hypothetical protein
MDFPQGRKSLPRIIKIMTSDGQTEILKGAF